MNITYQHQKFILDSARAIFHLDTRSIIIADVHLGKTTHFRKHGIAVPTNVAENDLARLSHVIQKYDAKKVIIAGDFFHATANSEIALFKQWKKRFHTIEFILIKGNHDRLSSSVYEDLGVAIERERLILDDFIITHHPQENPEKLTLCGHIHPGVNLKLKARQKVKLPCFLFQENQIILPAFSEFTGLDTSLQHTGRNYVIARETIVAIQKNS